MPHCHNGHDLALPPDSAQSAAQESAPTISSELTALTRDGRLDAAPGAATSTAIEPNTDLVPREARDSEVPDSSPDSEPPAPPPIESGWAPIMEFTVADVRTPTQCHIDLACNNSYHFAALRTVFPRVSPYLCPGPFAPFGTRI